MPLRPLSGWRVIRTPAAQFAVISRPGFAFERYRGKGWVEYVHPDHKRQAEPARAGSLGLAVWSLSEQQRR